MIRAACILTAFACLNGCATSDVADSLLGSADKSEVEGMQEQIVQRGYHTTDAQAQSRFEFRMRNGRDPFGSSD